MKNIVNLAFCLLIIGASLAYSQEDRLFDEYIDSVYCYKVDLPSWLKIKETGNSNMWGGTLPSINGCENAILIISFERDKYETFDEFKYEIVEKYKMGDNINNNPNQKFLLRKELEEIEGIGPSYKVQILTSGIIYNCNFVLTESKTAYIFINFTATPETYDLNLPKFKDFMSGFELIE